VGHRDPRPLPGRPRPLPGRPRPLPGRCPAVAPAVLGGTSASLASAVVVLRCRTGHLDRLD